MNVEAYFRFEGNDNSIVQGSIHKASKSLNSFFSGVVDNWGYGFSQVDGSIWCLSGDAVLIFKVLSILAEQQDGLSDVIAVDTYTNSKEYFAIKNSPEYKFRFVTPYYINLFDKESQEVIQEQDGPYTFKMAKELKEFYENGDDICDENKEVIVEILKGTPGIELEKRKT